MVNTGAPDYQDFTQWADDPFVSGTFNVAAVGTVLGTFNVSQWLGLQCFVTVPVVPVLLQFTWYADFAKTITCGIRQLMFDAFPNAYTTAMMPNMGVVVEIKATVAVDQLNAANIVIVPTNRVGPSFAPTFSTQLVEITAVNVNAGATAFTDFGFLYSGPVHLMASSPIAAGSIKLEWLDIFGVSHPFVSVPLPTPAGNLFLSPVYIPPAHVRARVQNTSGANGAYTLYVAADSWRVTS